MARTPAGFENWPQFLDSGPFRAVVQHITDGDTLDVLVDVAFNSYRYTTVRFKDVDAPEIFTRDAEEKARGYAARDHLETLCPVGTKALMHSFKDAQSFGRYIAVLVLADGTDVNSKMREWLGTQTASEAIV